MGWLWSSNSVSPASTDGKFSSVPAPLPEPSHSSPPSSQTAPLSRDEFAEKELQSFLDELQADVKPSSTKYNRVPKQTPPTIPSSSPSSTLPLSEQLLPTTMSCRNAFDSAFYCNSLGGQFNNLYRYGNARSCSENWNDFWFCMKTRTWGKAQKEEAIMARYREKERLRYRRQEGEERGVQKSSEDVWKSRESKVEWGTSFNEPYEDFDGDDAEWNKVQRNRRKGIADGTIGS